MAKIEVRITKNAEKDMMLIYEYILNDLKSPQTALKYFNQLASSINSLNLFPERCPIVKEFIKLGIKIRRLNVNNHAIFYKYENNIVTILRVFHASSNLENLIKDL
ncbi:type II toxin-antitoxin system RelE/ParE family toxin [Granulicatella elegans]|uniref:type II toxin-antitoxin system RelE/ParE family toxin n=1 Tax=Granulicatella elegans TaxID=137732 RepID=UPI003C760670